MFPKILPLFFLCSFVANAGYTSSTTSETFAKTRIGSLAVDVSIDAINNIVTLTMVGPSSVWFGYGFGNIEMSDSYFIYVDGDGNVKEGKLIGHTAGNTLESTFVVQSNTVSGKQRTVIVNRAYDSILSSSDYYQFNVDDSKLSMIWAYGSKSYLSDHEEAARGSSKMSMTQSSTSISSNNYVRTSNSSFHHQNVVITILIITFLGMLSIILMIVYGRHKPFNYHKTIDRHNDNDRYEEILDETERLVVV